MNQAKHETPKIVQPFEAHGGEWIARGKDQCRGTCPFCGKEKLHANPKNGLWDCKVCGRSGNVYTFLGEMAKRYEAALTDEKLRDLAKRRGIPWRALRGWGLGWDGSQYMLPVRSPSGGVVDIRRYSFKSGRFMSTKGCGLGLIGAEKLAKAKDGARVWLCEGEWDAMMLRWALGQCKRRDDVVVAVPGANVFKPEWAKPLVGKEMILCYDNDDAGRSGRKRAITALQNHGIQPRYIDWPDYFRDGWDVRDYLTYARENDVTMRKSIAGIERKLVQAERRQSKFPLYSTAELANRPVPEVVVEELKIRMGCFGIIYAPPGRYKSFLILKGS